MQPEKTVLSLNPDRQTLFGHEAALREDGFEIVSVVSPLQARFEIEMGRCGIFLISHVTPQVIVRDLTRFFRCSCPNGIVIFIAQSPDDSISDVDLILVDGDDPRSLGEGIAQSRKRKQANPGWIAKAV
jgi:hypothetical protein